MLLPSEMQTTEMVGLYEVTNPIAVRAVAETRRMNALRRRQNAKLGLTMEQAIEMALRQRPRLRDRGAAARQPAATGSGPTG